MPPETYQLILQPLSLLDSADNIFNEMKSSFNKPVKHKLILFIFEDNMSITKELLSKYDLQHRHQYIKHYIDNFLSKNFHKNSNNPYNTYQTYLKKWHKNIINIVDTVCKKLLSLQNNSNYEIHYIILPLE